MSLLSLRSLPSLALRVPSATLSAAATALRLLADVNRQLATTLKGRAPSEPPRSTTPTLSVVASEANEAAKADADVAGAVEAVETETGAPADIATLAALPAPRLLAALDSLSTQDLADLYDHESRHRRRQQVLAAIEVAAAPPEQARDDIVLDDVRVPDEVVYTTSTPR